MVFGHQRVLQGVPWGIRGPLQLWRESDHVSRGPVGILDGLVAVWLGSDSGSAPPLTVR